MSQTAEQTDKLLYKRFQKSPLFFIEKVWGLIPQPALPQYQSIVANCPVDEFKAEWFGITEGNQQGTFIKGKHLTWQQWQFFLVFEKAIRNEIPRRIAIESGVGTGKSSSLAMLILWFLFCFKDAQVPCTAPTGDQMYNALWKETNLWLGRMPERLQMLYEWSSNYIRIKERAETWYARARTASKDKPEALAGVHADFVLAVIDEASGVIDEVFEKGEGVLAGDNVFVVMISQHTRLIGYFHDAFGSDAENWFNLRFNSEESPIVDKQFVQRIIDKDGVDSDRYRVEVQGQSPEADAVDEKGYVPLFKEDDLREAESDKFVGNRRMGLDPAGDGSDNAEWTVRDAFKAKNIYSEEKSEPKGLASKSVNLCIANEVKRDDLSVDNFGIGADTSIELTSVGFRPLAVNVGEQADDPERFVNKRAEAFWRLREWVKSGGAFVNLKIWKKELLSIRFTSDTSGRIKIMSKKEMRKLGLPSPNKVDSLMLTFVDGTPLVTQYEDEEESIEDRFDRYAVV